MSTSASRPRIRFQFDPEKFVAAVAFLSSKIGGVDKLKAAKLLYYADKYHIVRYGRPIIGDVYYRLDYGPIPSKALDILNEAINPYKVPNIPQPNLELFQKYIKISKEGRRHPIFEAKGKPNVDVFSESEIEALEQTIAQYGKLSGGKLIDLTHHEASWKQTPKNGEIDYRLFFEDEKNCSPEAFDYLESFQEDEEFMFTLTAPS